MISDFLSDYRKELSSWKDEQEKKLFELDSKIKENVKFQQLLDTDDPFSALTPRVDNVRQEQIEGVAETLEQLQMKRDETEKKIEETKQELHSLDISIQEVHQLLQEQSLLRQVQSELKHLSENLPEKMEDVKEKLEAILNNF